MRPLAWTLLIAGCARSPHAAAPMSRPEAQPMTTGAAAPREQPSPPSPPPMIEQGGGPAAPGGPAPGPRNDASPLSTGIIGSAVTISLAFAAPLVSKGGDAKAIAAALASSEAGLLSCGTAPHDASTTVTVKLRIAASGKVARASATGDKQLESCFARQLEDTAFPAAKVAVDVVAKVAVTPPSFGSGFDDDQVYALHDRTRPALALGEPTTTGDLDKSIIRDEIRRASQKIVACYDLDPHAASGPLDVRFRIGPDGKVTSANATGLAQPVADCITRVIQQIAFPRPRGGGAIEVSYPFNFTAG